MLGDLRILDTGDELLLDVERSALQAIFDVLRRARVGFDAELHKRTLSPGCCRSIGPTRARVAGAEAKRCPRPSTRTRGRDRRASRCASSRPTSAST